MFLSIRLTISVGLCLIFGFPGVLAEEKARSSGIRFVCTELPAEGPTSLDLLLDPETGESVEVPLLRRTPGDYHPLPKEGKIRLGRAGADPEAAFETMALASKPGESRRLLAILVPVPESARAESAYPIAMQIVDESRFQPGDFYFLNLTPLEFAVSFDGERFGIRKGDSRLYEPDELDEPRNSPVMITFRPAGTEERWQVLTRSTWRLRPTRKEVCVFYWDERQGRPALRGLTLSARPEE